jgi:hypothetical protein
MDLSGEWESLSLYEKSTQRQIGKTGSRKATISAGWTARHLILKAV